MISLSVGVRQQAIPLTMIMKDRICGSGRHLYEEALGS
jgi:hypothetical protein